MNFKKQVLSASLLTTIIYCSTSIAASGLPEVCFESDWDYLTFTHFAFTKPPKFPSEFVREATKKYGDDFVRKKLEEGLAPARRKSVVINLQEKNNSSRGQVHLDASGSTTPSGKAEFTWINDATKANAGSSATLDVDHWSMDTVTLEIFDPVCRVNDSKVVEIPKR